MTYKPEYEVGPKSPGVWKEARRLEAEVERLRAENVELRKPKACPACGERVGWTRAALEEEA